MISDRSFHTTCPDENGNDVSKFSGIDSLREFRVIRSLFIATCCLTLVIWLMQLSTGRYPFRSLRITSAKLNEIDRYESAPDQHSEIQIIDPRAFLVTRCLLDKHDSLLPNLSRIQWPIDSVARTPAGGKNFKLPKPFKPVMSRGQRSLHKRLLRIFSQAMYNNCLADQFMLFHGSLLGSYRHHDFVPWDDDVDLLVNVSIRNQVRALLKKLDANYRLYGMTKLDKFYMQLSRPISDDPELEQTRPIYDWGWPSVDIFYFEENDSHIIQYKSKESWPRKSVYPLYWRPFGKNWYPTPRDVLFFLKQRYGSSLTCDIGYSHALEKQTASQATLCYSLQSIYAFVQRNPCVRLEVPPADSVKSDSDGMSMTKESLVLVGKNNYSKAIHHICLAVAGIDTVGVI